MKILPLTKNQVAFVDDSDYDWLSKFKWYSVHGYAARKTGRNSSMFLHKMILPEAEEVHHRDGNRANNQRYNLRSVTRAQNMQGKVSKKPGVSSAYRGVCWIPSRRKWKAAIQPNGKSFFIGHFSSEIEAARAYDTAARKYFGEFASPNFPL